MEKQLLREFMLFEQNDVKPIEGQGSNGILKMSGVIQRANSLNANGRIYPKHLLEREDKKMQEAIRDRGALGECDHPDSPVVQLENTSHLLTKTWWQDDDLMGEIEILDTPKGKILESLVKRKVKLGISSRGLGSTKRTNEGHDMVEDDFQLICYDLVSNPSTNGAWMNKLSESRDYRILAENNKELLLNECLDEILDLGLED